MNDILKWVGTFYFVLEGTKPFQWLQNSSEVCLYTDTRPYEKFQLLKHFLNWSYVQM